RAREVGDLPLALLRHPGREPRTRARVLLWPGVGELRLLGDAGGTHARRVRERGGVGLALSEPRHGDGRGGAGDAVQVRRARGDGGQVPGRERAAALRARLRPPSDGGEDQGHRAQLAPYRVERETEGLERRNAEERAVFVFPEDGVRTTDPVSVPEERDALLPGDPGAVGQ